MSIDWLLEMINNFPLPSLEEGMLQEYLSNINWCSRMHSDVDNVSIFNKEIVKIMRLNPDTLVRKITEVEQLLTLEALSEVPKMCELRFHILNIRKNYCSTHHRFA
jgi:hypothetical protein